MAALVKTTIRAFGLKEVEAKAAVADVNIMEQNRLMVEAMLGYVKPLVEQSTPLGPGHFGYHLRDMFTTDTAFRGRKTVGVLKSPPTGYWREFGTRGHARRFTSSTHHVTKLSAREAGLRFNAIAGGGERAYMTAHKQLAGAKRAIKLFYGGLASWWRY